VIGVTLLGAGRMARVHAKAIGAAGGRLVTVYDVVEPAAKSLAADTLRRAGSPFHVLHGPLRGELPQGNRSLSWQRGGRHAAHGQSIDGLRTAYLAEAASALLRLGQVVELQTNCEVSWHE
jgi:hypothetical protein